MPASKANVTVILDRLTRIEERSEATHSAVLDMDKKLFGNGQPGIISDQDKRIRRLEIALACSTGGGWVIMILLKIKGWI